MMKRIWILIVCLAVLSFYLTANSSEKKIEFEFAFGFSYASLDQLNQQNALINASADNTLAFYRQEGWKIGWDTISGTLNELKLMVPVSFSVNYHLGPKLKLKGSLEWAFGNNSSIRLFRASDADNNIKNHFNIGYHASYVMPSVGIEYVIAKDFSLLASLGYGFASFQSNYRNHLSNGSDIYYLNKRYHCGNGSGIAFAAGIKYRFKERFFIKLDYLYFVPDSFSGKSENYSDSWLGGPENAEYEGDFVSYESYLNYSGIWISDLGANHTGNPQLEGARNVKDFELDFSSFRLSFGITF